MYSFKTVVISSTQNEIYVQQIYGAYKTTQYYLVLAGYIKIIQLCRVCNRNVLNR